MTMDTAEPFVPERDGPIVLASLADFRKDVIRQAKKKHGPEAHVEAAAPSVAQILEMHSFLLLTVRKRLAAILFFHGRDGSTDMAVPEHFAYDKLLARKAAFDSAFVSYLLRWLINENFYYLFLGISMGDVTFLKNGVQRVAPKLLRRNPDGTLKPAYFNNQETSQVKGHMADLGGVRREEIPEPVLPPEHKLIIKKDGKWRSFESSASPMRITERS